MTSSFLLVCYFNLLSENSRITDKWMERRLELLEHITLKSIKGQSDQEFLFILLCASDTSEHYLTRIRAMMPENGVVRLVGVSETNFPCRNSSLLEGDAGPNLLKEYINPDRHGMVFTSQIDSDDALMREFVERTKNAFNFDEYKYHGFLYYQTGYVYYSEEDKFFNGNNDQYFFKVLREPVKTFRSTFCTNHTKLHRRAPAARIHSDAPMWLIVLHSDQMATYNKWRKSWNNRLLSTDHVGHNRVIKQFDIDMQKAKL